MHRTFLVVAALTLAIAACRHDARVTEPALQMAGHRITSAVGVDSATGASITTNQDDYAPGEIVHVSGAGWGAGETVHLNMTEVPDTHPDVTQDVTADSAGAFSIHFYDVQEHDLGVTFTLTATGQTSGSVATAVFTDGNFRFVTSPANLVTSVVYNRYNGSASCGGTPSSTNSTLGYGVGLGVNTGQSILITIPTVSGNAYSGYSISGTTALVSPASSSSNTTLCFTGTAPSAGTTTMTLSYVPSVTNTTTALAGAPNPSVSGQAVTFTATVTAGASPVTSGSVTFRTASTNCTDGSVLAASVALNASGQASTSATYDAANSPVAVRACYGGATGFNPSEGTLSQTINRAATALSLATSTNPSTYGQSVTFTATVAPVAPGAGAPTGSVSFHEFAAGGSCAAPNGTTHATTSLTGGSAVWSSSTLGAGAHAITACYGGDANFTGSSATQAQTVNPAPLTITASSGSKTFGTVYTVMPSYAGFVNGETASVLTTAPTCGSAGSPTTATVTGSPYASTCSGAAAANYAISYVPGSVTVTPAPTTLALAAPAPTQYSDRIRLSATVTPASPYAGQNQSGSVEFLINGVSVGTAPLSDDVATKVDIPNAYLPGSYSVTARFTSTNANFGNSNDGPRTQVISRENALVNSAAGNVGAIQVSQTSLTLDFTVREALPELDPSPDPDGRAAPGNIANASSLTATLNGVAGGANYAGTCTAGAVSGTGYSATRAFSCTFPGPFDVDAYTITTSVGGGYFVGSGEDVLSVYDPSLGFVTGGGKFVAADGDHVSFGLSFTYTGKGKTGFRGGWVVVKHHADGGSCRVKSNLLNAPAVNGTTASLSGKSNYSCTDALGNSYGGQGNIAATGYVEDNGTSGAGQDKFWIRAFGELLMDMPATTNARTLTGGNIQVPQPQGGK